MSKCCKPAASGGICAAIAAVALGRDFAHVRAGNLGSAINPFFKPWVEDIDISVLLDNGDLEDDGAQVLSILNATGLPRIVDTVLDTAEPPKRRRYVAEPLPVRFTVGNLKGIPYEIGMRGNTAAGHAMRVHGDDYSFLVGAPPAGPPDPPVPPDWVAVTGGSSSADPAWRKLGTACLASGAFPLFLLPKALRRERHALLDRRTFVIPGDGTNDPHHGIAREVEIEPTWPTPQPPDPYDFLCVDGGTMNNAGTGPPCPGRRQAGAQPARRQGRDPRRPDDRPVRRPGRPRPRRRPAGHRPDRTADRRLDHAVPVQADRPGAGA